MKDMFNDRDFEKMLEGGVQALDPDIGRLVHDLYKSQVVRTEWSCSGHIAVRHIDAGSSCRPRTHSVYLPGRLYFRENAGNAQSNDFIMRLREKVKKTRFATLQEETEDYPLRLVLEMSDIAHRTANALYGEVPIRAARQRYDEFKRFWKDVGKLNERYK